MDVVNMMLGEEDDDDDDDDNALQVDPEEVVRKMMLGDDGTNDEEQQQPSPPSTSSEEEGGDNDDFDFHASYSHIQWNLPDDDDDNGHHNNNSRKRGTRGTSNGTSEMGGMQHALDNIQEERFLSEDTLISEEDLPDEQNDDRPRKLTRSQWGKHGNSSSSSSSEFGLQTSGDHNNATAGTLSEDNTINTSVNDRSSSTAGQSTIETTGSEKGPAMNPHSDSGSPPL